MSNSVGEVIANIGFVLAGCGAILLTIEWFDRNERQLNEFVASVAPNPSPMEFAAVCIVCGFLLFLTGLLIDTYGDEFGGDS